MKSLKENISRNINIVMGFTQKSNMVNEGDTMSCRLRCGEADDKNKSINNHHKTIDKFHNQFIKKYGQNQTIIPKFKWQKSYYDHIIRNKKDFEYHYNYTVYNFQKHKLPDDWKYTSLNYENLVDGITL